MDADEREIYYYLKAHSADSTEFVPANSICRHAGGKHRYREEPDWARPVLLRMQERGIVEADASGAYRLKPMPKRDSPPKRWVSPQIAAILKKSGGKFDHVIEGGDEMDAYYDSL